ncbi:uncharacterized protein LOC114943613 [Nylanderia fulva]|uniref:uncharacterized protein LOC114930928 n=2 Tax=Nylanderia fulva TaxID=613905 RepID=UPI0010FB68E2|nr:uncharacterized protein LOC114930928 [Nylanderia fulva]XP_029158616.1 uncharacterized protein LOC114930929 [Nylanderia fulva]XP_029165609.1 uncharacterized protein LOC114936527 [Nylanderia fulva]XP_029175099.1 uncharacterized protein LOC114943613 [Nylanderia fulva]
MVLVQCVELILNQRKDANVPEKNPYVFGIPSSTKRHFKYLRACILMRYFSKKCDAQIPHSLRGTELRKHIATTCITLNLSDNEVDDLANFMGHHEKIHKRHYRQSIAAVEIVRMTKFLEAALGENEQQQSNNSDSEEEEMQETNKDTSSAESENDAETCMISSRKPSLLRTERKLPKFLSVTDEQQKSVKKKIVHQNHTIVNNDNDSDETYSPKIKKRGSTSPFGITKRRRWTEEERNTILKEFQKEITTSQLPSNKKISCIKEKNKCLFNRSVAQIKTWIHNYISGKFKRH